MASLFLIGDVLTCCQKVKTYALHGTLVQHATMLLYISTPWQDGIYRMVPEYVACAFKLPSHHNTYTIYVYDSCWTHHWPLFNQLVCTFTVLKHNMLFMLCLHGNIYRKFILLTPITSLHIGYLIPHSDYILYKNICKLHYSWTTG